MESDLDEPFLRPCKLLPSSRTDLVAAQLRRDQSLSCMPNDQNEINQETESAGAATQKLDRSHDDMVDETVTSQVRITKLLKGKEKEWAAAVQKEGPLRLLDLPLDVLKDILKEVTHTNDLTSLALTHSALHAVVTPIIYSRFDIVWPDASSNSDTRTGVDALTYGLATLVMREDLFENAMVSCGGTCQSYACTHCGSVNYLTENSKQSQKSRRLRRGNYFSQFTRKFSLGNGPADWVQEYLVTKESGKMLGTLVALSIARMPNLETFVWDMPTGVLRDIFIALSSLGDYQPSRLEKVWVRLHDNKAAQEAELTQPNTTSQPPQVLSGPTTAALPLQSVSLPETDVGGTQLVWSDHPFEQPNFSIMPSLRSLTVLDIDEAAYLVELSVLLERSLDTLRELRIGIAPNLHSSGYVSEDTPLKRLLNGGIIALLMSGIYDHLGALDAMELRKKPTGHMSASSNTEPVNEHSTSPVAVLSTLNIDSSEVGGVLIDASDMHTHEEVVLSPSRPRSQASEMDFDTIDPALLEDKGEPELDSELVKTIEDAGPGFHMHKNTANEQTPSSLTEFPRDCAGRSSYLYDVLNPPKKLHLEILEMEKITLNVHVLQKAIDWSIITSLTLLQCGDHEVLWDSFRRTYAPRAKSLVLSIPTKSSKKPGPQPRLRRMPSSETLLTRSDYRLSLKRIHTDTVSKSLISFLKNTLAPNSLEWMFLQDNGMSSSLVTVDAIYRGPLRRHRASLTKVMIDSGNGRRRWMLTREVLTFVTSGKMSRLRELALSVEYKEWHFFLQRLPRIPHLRSLYVPYIADHVYNNNLLNERELALGVVDVVALRPDIELCYLGILTKCFEILETKARGKYTFENHAAPIDADDDSEFNDQPDTDHDDNDDDDNETADPDGSDSDAGEQTTTSDDEETGLDSRKNRPKLKLREILFYDDKISIFKARHGRL